MSTNSTAASSDNVTSVNPRSPAQTAPHGHPAPNGHPPPRSHTPTHHRPGPCGIAGKPPLFHWTYAIELVVSLSCLLLAVLAIKPEVGFAAYLGLQKQIIIIGALLIVMNQCMKMHLLPRCFLMVEIARGRSILQNYSAILTNDLLARKVDWLWRIALVVTLAMPIALSAGYKAFLGGVSSHRKYPKSTAEYGLNYPALGDFATMNNSIYLMMSSAAGFRTAASDDSNWPPEYPAAYGFNLLLLSDNETAALDIPMPGYLEGMQSEMTANETWTVNASVNAFVATFNQSTKSLRVDDDFMNETLPLKDLHSFSLFDTENEFAALPGIPQDTDGVYYLLGSFPLNGQGPALSNVGLDDQTRFKPFRENALLFNIRRRKCWGKWNITSSGGIKLDSGSCNDTTAVVKSEFLRHDRLWPFWLDTLPVLVHSLGKFAKSRNQSPWLRSSYATAAVTAWWARSIHMRDFSLNLTGSDSLKYAPPAGTQVVNSFVQTLDAKPGLYIIIALQPFLTALAALACFTFHSLPVGKGFGLVSILAGVDSESLNLLKGAGFSGALDKQIYLQFLDVAADAVGGHQYRLSEAIGTRLRRISRKRDYE